MTLNQAIKRIKDLALTHKQIASVSHGYNIGEFLTSDLKYPAFYLLIGDSYRLDRANRQTILPVTLFVLDQINIADKAEENEDEVYSDTLSIMEDMKSLIENEDLDWEINATNNGNWIKESEPDYLGGVSLDMEIAWDYLSNRCQVPD